MVIGIVVIAVAIFVGIFLGTVAAKSARTYRPEDHKNIIDLHVQRTRNSNG